jgi:hypothetical protein
MRYWLLLAVWAAWTALGSAQTGGQKVGFEPGLYSFEQIAMRLSTETRQVRCDPSLRQRIAFLSLKPRTWEELKHLLEYSLDLCIRPTADKDSSREIWIMERDKKVLSQEQLMRKQFADLLARYFAGKTAPPPRQLNVFEILSSLPRSITDTELRHLRLQAGTHIGEVYPKDEDAEETSETSASLAELLAKRIRKAAELEVSPELREWAQQQANLDRRAFIWRFGSYFGGHFYGEDETTRAKFALFALAEIERYRSRLLLAERFVRNFPSSLIEESIQNGHAFRVFYLRPDDEYLQMVLQDELESIQSEDNRVAIKPNGSPMAVLRCEFNSSEMAFIVSLYLLVGSKRMRIDLPYYEYTPEHGLNTESLIAVFKEIDESIADKYKVATETHQDWLKQAVQAWQQDMHLTTKFPSYLSLYSWMAVLATEKKQEVIVEVYPARALLETEGGPHLQVGLKDMARKLSTNGVWRAELNEGVLIWRNWLSFIDRAVDLPLATLLRWAEESKKYPADFQHLRRSISASQANNLAMLNPIIALQDLALSVKDEYFGQLKLATLGQQWFAWYWVDTLFGSARKLSEGTIPLSKVPFGRFKRCIEVYLRYTIDSELHEWLWLNALSDLAILLHQRGEARISESRYRGHILELNLDGSIVLSIPVQKLYRPQRE